MVISPPLPIDYTCMHPYTKHIGSGLTKYRKYFIIEEFSTIAYKAISKARELRKSLQIPSTCSIILT